MANLTNSQKAALEAIKNAVGANGGEDVNNGQVSMFLKNNQRPHSDVLKALEESGYITRPAKGKLNLPVSKAKPAPKKAKKVSGVAMTRTSVSFPDNEADRKAVLEFCANLRAKAAA